MSPHDSQRVNSGGLTAPRQSLRPSFLYLPAPRIGPICRQTWKPGGGREARGFSNGPLGSLPGFFTTTAAVFRLLLSNKLMFQPIVCLSVIKAPPQQQSLLSEPTLEILFKPNCQPATSAAAPTVMCEQTWALQSSSLGDRPRDWSFILLRFSDRWQRFPLNSSASFGI